MCPKERSKNGYALIVVIFFTAVFLILTVGVMALVNAEIRMGRYNADSTTAFFLAEAGIERAMATIRDTGAIAGVPSSLTLSQLGGTGNATLDSVTIGIQSAVVAANVFQITSSATIGDATRTIVANIMYNPPSEVFDYCYFINNWGWFYGNTITANGDVRSNGWFDCANYSPTIEGEIYAGEGIIATNVQGKAATEEDGELIYQHPYSPIVEMPNLQDLSYYQGLAEAQESTISVGGTVVIDGVYGDDAGESGNIVLVGTAADPIVIDGPIVATGDIVITGVVSGQGTVYSGRNVYVAGNISYNNPPSTPRPASDDPAVIDQWVADNSTNDVVGFAATENIILGDYTGTTGGAWYANNWLFGMGNEDVGEDGIPDTGDTGENDGEFQSAYEDLDGDGVFDDNYTWTDVQTQADITTFANVPVGVTSFGDLATSFISEIEGIYYTNHACTGRVGYDVFINGTIISKDEAIVYRNHITLNFDERVHSRYTYDPNWLIDLQLPFAERVGIAGWWEQ